MADRDEDILTAEDRSPPATLATINGPAPSAFRQRTSSLGLNRPRARGLLNRVPAPAAAPTAFAGGSYQSVIGHGLSYSTGASPAAPAIGLSYAPAPYAAPAPAPFHPSPAYTTTTNYAYPAYPAPAPAYSSTISPLYPVAPAAAFTPAPAPASPLGELRVPHIIRHT